MLKDLFQKGSTRVILHSSVFLMLLLIAVLVFVYMSSFSKEQITEVLFGYSFSLWVLFMFSLVEGFLFLGLYSIGGVVMFLYVVFAQSVEQVIVIILVIWMALSITCFLNYGIGRMYCGSKKLPKYFDFDEQRLKSFNFKSMLFCFHTTTIAFLCFYLGYRKKPILMIIPIILIVLCVLILYASIIYVVFNQVV